MNIDWKRGSAFNFGYIEGTDYRVERMRGENSNWGFLLSDKEKHYMFISACIYPTKEELEEAILKEVKKRGSTNNS